MTESGLADQQRADPELRLIVDYLEERNVAVPSSFKRTSAFCLKNSVLVKNFKSATGTNYLLVIPAGLRDEIFEACHDEPPSPGHIETARTLGKMKTKYYWPRLASDVIHYVRSCSDCKQRKTPPTKPAGLLQPIATPSKPFQQMGMDLLGPFTTSRSENVWIVVATEYMTRHAETAALPKGTGQEVAKFFIHEDVLRHGAPEVVITDRGTAFIAELMQ